MTYRRIVITAVDVDPKTGAGIPDTGYVRMFVTQPCPATCSGTLIGEQAHGGIRWFGCDTCRI